MAGQTYREIAQDSQQEYANSMPLISERPAPELVVFIGLPGAGKSTFYEQQFAGTHVHVSKDKMPSNRKPERRQQLLIREALNAGHNVVVDNTNPSAASRAALLEIGRELRARLLAYFFDVPREACIQRNRQRAGKARVPDVAIYVIGAKLQPPVSGELFDEIYYVSPVEPGGVQVKRIS